MVAANRRLWRRWMPLQLLPRLPELSQTLISTVVWRKRVCQLGVCHWRCNCWSACHDHNRPPTATLVLVCHREGYQARVSNLCAGRARRVLRVTSFKGHPSCLSFVLSNCSGSSCPSNVHCRNPTHARGDATILLQSKNSVQQRHVDPMQRPTE